MAGPDDYGAAKVACEAAVLAAFGPDRSLIVRPGLIAGPGDVSDRTGYWPMRFARPSNRSAEVLVPDAAGESVQVIDVRDLAPWVVQAAADGRAGIFNAVGASESLTDHLAAAREVAGHTGPVVVAAGEWLTAHGVSPWSGPRSLPLWIGDPEMAGFGARDNSGAVAAGLLLRPVDATLADTLAWELSRAAPAVRRAGLTDEDERVLLTELRPSANRLADRGSAHLESP
jgi:nucleoside-diphosphate-sugar epimerase